MPSWNSTAQRNGTHPTDGVADNLDKCVGFDDSIDNDGDSIPDGCDSLVDSDFDGVIDSEDLCDGYDDLQDLDSDSIPDGCDDSVEKESTSNDQSGSDMSAITSAIGGGILLILVAGLVSILMRKGEEKPEQKELEDEVLFEIAQKSELLPIDDGPDPSITGDIKDGFEWIEHPTGSGIWFFKDKDTLQWKKH